MNFTQWLDTFVDEKGLNRDQVLTVEGRFGRNYIPLECLLDQIKSADRADQAGIRNTIVKIDFVNGNVMHFFQHLAQAIAV